MPQFAIGVYVGMFVVALVSYVTGGHWEGADRLFLVLNTEMAAFAVVSLLLTLVGVRTWSGPERHGDVVGSIVLIMTLAAMVVALVVSLAVAFGLAYALAFWGGGAVVGILMIVGWLLS